ncbi:hypothetical protein LAU42_07230 [Macrococcus armenti]|uniref:hypothetical protein n=1 Tax=Macrococcus armenti TaxID=2875764 RepID=UPI001CCD608C|nr:hypothetical protein [Macrococcus armenti]UBH21588.1 hypothetical protein LAU42_07230 [Macrococcus armenti]
MATEKQINYVLGLQEDLELVIELDEKYSKKKLEKMSYHEISPIIDILKDLFDENRSEIIDVKTDFIGMVHDARGY